MKLLTLGAGNMAEAIVRGLPDDVTVTAVDPSPERRAVFDGLGATTAGAISELAADADVVMLAVKPQVAAGAVPAVAGGDALVVSIMAGVTTATIDGLLGGGRRVVRVMPNTPMLVGRGACGIAAGADATPEDVATVRRLFGHAAEVVEVPEDLIDALSAVSGSGPAYLFYLAEHMTAAGVELGLSPEHADLLTRQTLLGAAEMLAADPGTAPAELRRRVSSPGGSTLAATDHADAAGVPATIRRALAAARDRGRELAGGG